MYTIKVVDRSPIQLPTPIKKRLLAVARREGYQIRPGPGGQTAEFISWLLDKHSHRLDGDTTHAILLQFLDRLQPELAALRRALAIHGTAVEVELSTQEGRLCIRLSSATTTPAKPTRVGLAPKERP